MPPRFLKESLRGFHEYVPGQQPPDGERWIKLNTNESPYPPSPKVLDAIRAAVDDNLRLYPSPTSQPAREAIGRAAGLEAAWVCLGNGGDELIEMFFRVFVSAGERVAYPWPTYPLLEPLCHIHECVPGPTPLGAAWALPAEFATDPAPLKFLVNPNSPTGTWFRREEVEAVVAGSTGVVILDEAYVDFAPESRLDLLKSHDNLIILRTFSKAYALAGMRIGYALAHPDLIAALDLVRDSYNVDRLAIVAAVAAIEDRAYRDHLVSRVVADREWLGDELTALDFEASPSASNFIFTRPPDGISAATVQQGLRKRKILVRHFAKPPLDGWLRITVGSREELSELITGIAAILREDES